MSEMDNATDGIGATDGAPQKEAKPISWKKVLAWLTVIYWFGVTVIVVCNMTIFDAGTSFMGYHGTGKNVGGVAFFFASVFAGMWFMFAIFFICAIALIIGGVILFVLKGGMNKDQNQR